MRRSFLGRNGLWFSADGITEGSEVDFADGGKLYAKTAAKTTLPCAASVLKISSTPNQKHGWDGPNYATIRTPNGAAGCAARTLASRQWLVRRSLITSKKCREKEVK
jgi:hypothetical protein